MTALGSFLPLASGLVLRHELIESFAVQIRLGEELSRLLDVLRHGIFRLQQPLPELILSCRKESRYSKAFWADMLDTLGQETEFLSAWQYACRLLPTLYAPYWSGIGAVLTAGEQEEVLILTREEIHRTVMQLRQKKEERDRLVTTLCLSASLLLTVVLM